MLFLPLGLFGLAFLVWLLIAASARAVALGVGAVSGLAASAAGWPPVGTMIAALACLALAARRMRGGARRRG